MTRTILTALVAVTLTGGCGAAPAEQAACDRALEVVGQDLTGDDLTAAWDQVVEDAVDTAVEDEARQATAATVEAPTDELGYPLHARRVMEACVDDGALDRVTSDVG